MTTPHVLAAHPLGEAAGSPRRWIAGYSRFSRCWMGLHRWDSPGGHCEKCGKCDEFFGPHDHHSPNNRAIGIVYLERIDHTVHCLKRQKWGDGTCECGMTATLPATTETAKARSRSLERMVRPLTGTSSQLWQRTILGAWILREEHDMLCGCSYCREMGGTIGLALPEYKARNSWRVLWWVRNNRLQVLRWTLPHCWPNQLLDS